MNTYANNPRAPTIPPTIAEEASLIAVECASMCDTKLLLRVGEITRFVIYEKFEFLNFRISKFSNFENAEMFSCAQADFVLRYIEASMAEGGANPNHMELHGNQQTMNLENILHLNILQSPYFKDLLYVVYTLIAVRDTDTLFSVIKTYHEVLEEVKEF